MENDGTERSMGPLGDAEEVGVFPMAHKDDATGPPSRGSSCPSCAGVETAAPMGFVYAFGRIEARFPRLGVEKEFAQVAGRSETTGKTDSQVFFEVLSKPENRYLARQLCWVMTIQGLETYVLRPRDASDLSQLLGAIRTVPSPDDIDIVVGVRGPLASPETCNGLMVPVVLVDQIYSFDRGGLVKALPIPEKACAERFAPAAAELLDRILQLADNAGATDDHRALNYLAARYPAIYSRTAEEFERNASLTGVAVRPSRLGGTRRVVDVVFAYTNRHTDFTEKWFVRVDVTETFPFLVTKLSPFLDR